MSILKVDTINEKTSGNGVAIPGHVIQVVSTRFTTHTTISSGGFTSVGSLSITPKLSNSKIYINTTNHVYITGGNANSWRAANVKLLRASTLILDGSSYDTAFYGVDADDRSMDDDTVQFMDTPNTTSAIAYSIQYNRRDSTMANVQVNHPDYGRQGFMILQEIAQ
jgi:hypothetical protein